MRVKMKSCKTLNLIHMEKRDNNNNNYSFRITQDDVICIISSRKNKKFLVFNF